MLFKITSVALFSILCFFCSLSLQSFEVGNGNYSDVSYTLASKAVATSRGKKIYKHLNIKTSPAITIFDQSFQHIAYAPAPVLAKYSISSRGKRARRYDYKSGGNNKMNGLGKARGTR